MRANFVVSGVATGIRRNLTMTIALVLSTAIALAFVGAAVLARSEISRFKSDYEGRLNASIYLCASTSRAPCLHKTTPAETTALQQKLVSDPRVASFSYVSEIEQVRRYDATATPEAAKLTQVGDLPASFTVHLKNINKDFDSFVADYKTATGVSATTNASEVLKTLLRMIDGARIFSIGIAVVVLIASILLIANTIQVAASQRKNETSIMRLVGASRWMTELPFMIETIVASLIGGLIALGLIAVGKQLVLNGIFRSAVQRHVIPDLSTNDVLLAGGVGIFAGIVLAALTAFATLRLYVKL
jgi:cell division transport system permease protein